MKVILFLILFIAFPFFLISQNSDFQSLSARGNEFIDKEDYPKALLIFEKALQIGTDNQADLIWTATVAGICAQQTGDLIKAFSFFETAIKNNCKDEDVYNRGLQIAEQLNDHAMQELMLLAACQNIDETHQKYANKLLNLYFSDQQFDKAVSLANKLLVQNPTQTQVLGIKGFSLNKLGKQDEAIAVFELMLARNPSEVDGLRQLGQIYYDRGCSIKDNAKDAYESIKKPTQVNYIEYRIESKNSLGNFRKALPYLENAYQIRPDDELKKVIFNTCIWLENEKKANQYR